MTDKELVLETLRRSGKQIAEAIQSKSAEISGTELNAEKDYIPDFAVVCAKKNMLERKAGFVCKSSAGRVVKLIQPYNSTIYTQEPEELLAQWGFVWSKDPKHALPFIALSTSPYNTDECCTHEGHVWKSGQDGNIWAPGTVGVKWEDLGPEELYK